MARKAAAKRTTGRVGSTGQARAAARDRSAAFDKLTAYDKRNSVLLSLGRTYHGSVAAFEKLTGITAAKWRILFLIDSEPECTQKRLTDLIEVDPGSITRQVKRLEAEGYIRREDDPRDNRLTRIFLTARGRQYVDRKMQLRREFLQRMLVGIPAKDVEQLQATLKRIYLNVSDESPG